MTARLTKEEQDGIVAAIKAGKLTSIIAVETGRSPECIRYVAAKYRLTLTSRYSRLRPGTYWRDKLRHRVMQAIEGHDTSLFELTDV